MVYLFLADGFEEIEALSVVDVLRRAGIDIYTVSINETLQVTGRSKITVTADISLEKMQKEQIDMIVLPGGMPGTLNLDNNKEVQDIIKYAVENDKWIAAICAAPSILGKKGYLASHKAACYPGFEQYLEGAKVEESKVVVSGKFITSRGAGTALDFSYELVAALKGREIAEQIKKQMLSQ